MSRERQPQEGHESSSPIRNADALVAVETFRAGSNHYHGHDEEPPVKKSEEKLSIFWRVFGGTILSIVALVVLTAFNHISSSLNELRRDVNAHAEWRGETVKKEELNNRLTTLWNSIKELQSANNALLTLNERAKLLEQHLDRQIKIAEEDRKDLGRKIEDIRKETEDDRLSGQKKLEEQRKSVDDDRREFGRRLDELRKALEDERRDFQGKLQILAERLASLEARQAAKTITADGK